jgi:hypothetical protein
MKTLLEVMPEVLHISENFHTPEKRHGHFPSVICWLEGSQSQASPAHIWILLAGAAQNKAGTDEGRALAAGSVIVYPLNPSVRG